MLEDVIAEEEDAIAEGHPVENEEEGLQTQLPDSDEAEMELELQFAAEEETNPGTFNPDASNPVEEEKIIILPMKLMLMVGCQVSSPQ
jgi:hypothetical protein